MPIVRGCNLPDDLPHEVENYTWFKELDDGDVRLGMTTVATLLTGRLLATTPKKVGRSGDAGKSAAAGFAGCAS